jgi:ankyrin repeat protein
MASTSAAADDPSAAAAATDPEPERVLRAVKAGASADELRRIIEQCAAGGTGQSREESRLAAVNYRTGEHDFPPLRIAHGARRGDLVGALLEAGADAKAAFGPDCSPLALAIHHGQTDTLRALLRSGRHHAEEGLAYGPVSTLAGAVRQGDWCRPVHVALAPPKWPTLDSPQPPPNLAALEVLVREFGADVNARSSRHETPMHWFFWAYWNPAPSAEWVLEVERAVDALVALGADIDARAGRSSDTLLHLAAYNFPSLVPHFLSRGASANIFTDQGLPPLMRACMIGGPHAPVNIPLLLEASSRETRRVVNSNSGESALDQMLKYYADSSYAYWRPAEAGKPWVRDVIADLMLAGAPVLPSKAPLALPHAARLGRRLAARAAAREHGPPTWRTHDLMVQLALDHQEGREVDEGVRAREVRVAELEMELLGLEEQSEGGSSDEESGGNDDDDDDDDEGSGGRAEAS